MIVRSFSCLFFVGLFVCVCFLLFVWLVRVFVGLLVCSLVRLIVCVCDCVRLVDFGSVCIAWMFDSGGFAWLIACLFVSIFMGVVVCWLLICIVDCLCVGLFVCMSFCLFGCVSVCLLVCV